MNSRFLSAAAAAGLSITLIAGASYAQDELGLKQSQDSASIAMSRLGIDTSMVDSLTLEELTRIEAAASTSESDQIKADRINVILADAEARIAQGGSVIPQAAAGDVTNEDLAADMVLKANLQKNLTQAGVDQKVDPDSLTTEQLTQIELISSGPDAVDVKRSQIERILAGE